jgi:hypothetical protein
MELFLDLTVVRNVAGAEQRRGNRTRLPVGGINEQGLFLDAERTWAPPCSPLRGAATRYRGRMTKL